MRMPPFQVAEGRARTRRSIGILLSLLLIITSIVSIITLQRFQVQAANTQLLPGQQIWRQGTSSLLFGANDSSWQWSKNNMGNNPAIAAALRAAGITVIRAPLHTADAQARVSAIEAAGAKCLGILSPADAAQVVQILGNRCNMYEWMNEPDNGGPSASAYASLWNKNIPQLRVINPNAMFIGPVVASPNLGYIQQFLTLAKQAGNLPDVVSFHMYPCTDQSIASCPPHATSYGPATAQVRATVKAVVGSDLPLAITEWNYSWKPDQTPQNDPFIKTFTAQSIQSMAQAGIVMATQYDIASNAGHGTLDMINPQSGQALPQLAAMQQAIQQYQTVQTPPTTVPSVVTSPITGGLPTPQPPIQTPVSIIPAPTRPIAVDQLPPVVVVGAPEDQGTFVVSQQLHCVPGAPSNVQVSQIEQPTTNNAISMLGMTQDGCSLVFNAQKPQTIRVNWWNAGMAVTNKLTFQLSSDSTNGTDGTWQDLPPTTFTAAGGSQVVMLSNPSWVKISLAPPALNTPTVDLVIELYILDAPTNGGGDVTNSQPISLPRH